MQFYDEKDLAVCGLACVLCREEKCPGCKAREQAQGCDCSVFECAVKKGLDGCYECADFPCIEDMLKGMRKSAFNKYAKQYGKQDLLERLKTNFENSITYHEEDGLIGDYDSLESEEDIQRLVRFGTHNPYIKCPPFYTEHFILRLVSLDDAEDLMKCYSDPKVQKLFNSANCTSDFCFKSLIELQEYMRGWLDAYERHEFIRYAIIDTATSKIVGTIGMIGKYKKETGILCLDIIPNEQK